jgi:hypothetical protein
VCVRVSAKGDGVDMAVTAGICASGPGGGRQATMREQQLFRLWGACHLASDGSFAPGQLVQCLKMPRARALTILVPDRDRSQFTTAAVQAVA